MDRLDLDSARRSLAEYLAELQERYDALPLTDKRRADLARRIREIEDQIDAGSGL